MKVRSCTENDTEQQTTKRQKNIQNNSEIRTAFSFLSGPYLSDLVSCICSEKRSFRLFGCSFARGLLYSLLPWLDQMLQWLCMDLCRKHSQFSSSKFSGYNNYSFLSQNLGGKVWNWPLREELFFSILNPFTTSTCSQLQIKNAHRHGFTYSILPLTHSTFFEGQHYLSCLLPCLVQLSLTF